MRFALVTLLLLTLAACASGTRTTAIPTVNEIQAVDAVYARWRTAVEAADIPGYVAVLHPDVRMLPPGAAPVVGSNSYANFLEPVFAAADYKIEVVQMPIIEVFGDLAVVEYEYVIHLALKEAEVGISEPGALTGSRTHARYFDVLRKRSDGQWGVWRHAWQNIPNG